MFWFLFPKNSLYDQYFESPSLALVERSNANGLDLPTIEQDFAEKRYDLAKSNLLTYLDAYPQDLQAQLALGICDLELDEVGAAQAIFEKLHEGRSTLKYSGTWYLALSFLKENNHAEVETLLSQIPDDSGYYEKAQQLLNSLKN